MDYKQLSQTEFAPFRKLIWDRSGISIAENKTTLLTNRLKRRLKATSLRDFSSYLLYLESNAGKSEWQGLLDAVTTNETSFFRTEKHFTWLQTDFLNHIKDHTPKGDTRKTLNIWSAACSSGEEPLSIAISLLESKGILPFTSFQVIATDISELILSKARLGEYSAADIESMPPTTIKKYFEPFPPSSYRVKSILRDKVKFLHHNLLQPAPANNLDCVFLRNVLIYFNRESKQQVISRIVKAIAPGGFLVTGPSEGIFDMLPMLIRHSPSIFQKPL